MPMSKLRLRSGPMGSTAGRVAAGTACSSSNRELCDWKTDGALMPLPALNVTFVSPTGPRPGLRRYAATDTRGVTADWNTALRS